MDDWNIPEISQDTLYVPETIKEKHNFDYIIRTVEINIPLGQDIGEEFHLLSNKSIYEYSRKYKHLHIDCVQVAIKPLIDMGIDAAVLMCLRDIRIQYKVMNTCASRVLLKPQKGETTLFITDMTKVNVSLPRTIKWDEVTLPEKWDNSGKVEITFNRRNSFSSRIEASRSKYESARRSFSVKTHSIPVGLTRSESHNQFPIVNLQGLNTTSSIPRTTYNQEQEDDQKSIQSPTYSSIEPYDVI
ncbi:hypothetical protein JHK82_055193 [Glycine max]|uniref:Uncharacterized protein n=1 Tax=Glycine max TaxID=3847 RepID=A0A0R0EHQ8_SOYBN|nr:hypothetical protein JHK85_056006 [Glycine max]KAG5076498.1 hypothetical protein JHK82_055193 [Glycine max]KAH1034411.1 hypothetical protein GYH30_054707 [Glycine max]